VILRYLSVQRSDTDQQAAEGLKAAAALLEQLRRSRPPGTARSDLDREYHVYPSLLRRLRDSNATGVEEFSYLQRMRARRLMETLTAAGGDPEPFEPVTVGELQELLARQPRLTTFVDITETDAGLRAYLVDRAGLRTVDVNGGVAELHRVQWGDVRKRATEVVALVAGSQILADLAAVVTGQLNDGSTVLLTVDDGLANLPLHAIPVGDMAWGDVVSIGRIPAAGVLRFTPADRAWSGQAVVAGDSHNDLPGAHGECVAVADKLGAVPIIGDACTVGAVRDALTVPDNRLDVVHLAVHGRADARRGGRSSLLFAGERPTWVAFSDLAELPWNANLIVLSGCSTAVGGPRNGLGLYGVAQAAAEAGATTVIASLWPVDDTSAEIFMKAFYGELSGRRGSGLIDLRELMDHARTRLRQTTSLGQPALRRDGRELIIDEQDSDPPATGDALQTAMMHWAPFVLIGEPTLIV
jgi:CHAT domain-containing protein